MARTGETFVNPCTGQRMRFCRTAGDGDGSVLQIETVNPPGPAEPEHVHPKQESSAVVLSGTLHFSVRDQTHIVPAGEKIVFPANTPHYFWNEGNEEARAIQEFRPVLRTEDFFVTYFGLAKDGLLNEKGMPPPLHLAVLTLAFRDEIRPTRPPWLLLRLLAMLLSPLARRRGYQAVCQRYSSEPSREIGRIPTSR